jgi:micrococcal nuclease
MDTGRITKRIVLMVLVSSLLLSFGLYDRAVAGEKKRVENVASVERVNDGDTITVRLDRGHRERIRLIGIDAPEMGQRPWGERARRHLKSILSSSRNIFVEYDVERRDKYGRLLAYIKTVDGRLVNAEMLKDGYAVLFTFPPNIRHVEEFTSAQRQARERRLGIWSHDGLSQPPVEYRKAHPRSN